MTHTVMGSLLIFLNCPVLGSFLSTLYPVIGAPPSDLGSAHLILMKFLSESSTSGLPGLDGLVKGFLALVALSVSRGSLKPCNMQKSLIFLVSCKCNIDKNICVCKLNSRPNVFFKQKKKNKKKKKNPKKTRGSLAKKKDNVFA